VYHHVIIATDVIVCSFMLALVQWHVCMFVLPCGHCALPTQIKLFLKTGHIVADTGGSGDQGKAAAAAATNSTMAAANASKTTEAALKFM
jgi:hypothetical protein